MTTFAQYVMRTLDVDVARAFYNAVLGHDRAAVVRLHEQAIARGAPPHWLGVLGVRDVAEAVEAFERLGAQHLGGTPEFASMRDPGGAVFGMASGVSSPSVDVGWHVLNTNDMERSVKAYESVCAWHMADTLNIGSLGSTRVAVCEDSQGAAFGLRDA